MICHSCREKKHPECKNGTWCDCQHKEPLKKLPLPAEDC